MRAQRATGRISARRRRIGSLGLRATMPASIGAAGLFRPTAGDGETVMAEANDVVVRLLEQSLEAQGKTNSMLTTVIVDIAVLKRSYDGHHDIIAEIRESMGRHEARIRAVELDAQKINMLEGRETAHGQRQETMERRIRGLEQGSSETKVVTGGVREVLKIVAGLLIGAAVAGVGMALRAG